MRAAPAVEQALRVALLCACSASALSISASRRSQRTPTRARSLRREPSSRVEVAEKAARLAGVARRPDRIDQDEQRVRVAVDVELAHEERCPLVSPFSHSAPARSAEERRLARSRAFGDRLAVHVAPPCAPRPVSRSCTTAGNEPVLVEFQIASMAARRYSAHAGHRVAIGSLAREGAEPPRRSRDSGAERLAQADEACENASRFTHFRGCKLGPISALGPLEDSFARCSPPSGGFMNTPHAQTCPSSLAAMVGARSP